MKRGLYSILKGTFLVSDDAFKNNHLEVFYDYLKNRNFENDFLYTLKVGEELIEYDSKFVEVFNIIIHSQQVCIRSSILKDEKLMSQLNELKGKVLGCWCAP